MEFNFVLCENLPPGKISERVLRWWPLTGMTEVSTRIETKSSLPMAFTERFQRAILQHPWRQPCYFTRLWMTLFDLFTGFFLSNQKAVCGWYHCSTNINSNLLLPMCGTALLADDLTLLFAKGLHTIWINGYSACPVAESLIMLMTLAAHIYPNYQCTV